MEQIKKKVGRPRLIKPIQLKRERGRPKKETTPNPLQKSDSIEVTRVFIENREANKKILINRGGARSSKSYSILQLLIDNFFSIPGRQILIARKTSPALRRSCYRDVVRYLRKLDVYDLVKENKSELAMYYGDSLIQFVGLDDPDKIKSTEWNDIFMEEANEFDYNDYMVLKTRLSAPDLGIRNKLFMAFNPEDSFHWIKEKIVDLGDKDCLEIHSSYKDNPFLSQDYINLLEELEQQNYNFYRIYGLGEWGKLDHLIYQNWDLVEKVPHNVDEWFYGVDFGYNAPAAVIKISIKDEEVWEEELLYETNLTNTDLIARMKELIPVRERTNRYVFCDSAEPDRIDEIQAAGFTAIPAEKKVKEGIDMVQRQKIHITQDSVNLIKEKRSYSWKQDKRTNHILDDPIKFNDHLMDAERYAIFTYFKEIGAIPEIRWL